MSQMNELRSRCVDAYRRQSWLRVLRLAPQLLSIDREDAEINFMAGMAHLQHNHLPQALEHLDTATRQSPDTAEYAVQFARALTMARRMNEAIQIADRALALSPQTPALLGTLGVVYTLGKSHHQAVAVFRRLVLLTPMHAPCRSSLASNLIAIGDFDAAASELEMAVSLDPTLWNAHLNLAHLRQQTAESNHLERLNSLLGQFDADPDARIYLGMAMAKEFEDLGEYAKSFDFLLLAKSAGRDPRHQSMMDRDEAMFSRLMRTFRAPQEATIRGDPERIPLFIIGMPRTGTTLLERIVSSHPQVESAGELENFTLALQKIAGGHLPLLLDPDLPSRIADIDWHEVGSTYLSNAPCSDTRGLYFIDKMPHNFLYAGFIAKALPQAKILCLRRDPLDTCLSNFRHLFERDSSFYEYSYDLMDTGRHYVMFDRLMNYWRQVIPGRILDVSYEDLVSSQEACSRQVLAFCGLEWSGACLDFEVNSAPASSNAVTVRRPIYPTGVQRWRRYEPQLRELRASLIDAGVLPTS